MALYTCLHPVTFKHHHTGDTMTVPCGHCDFCRQSKYVQILRLCEYEQLFSKYALFITLTYDDDHLPFVYFNGEDILDPSTGEIIPFDFTLTLHEPKKIPVTYRYHVQTFLKRLRKHLSKYSNCPYEQQTFSFFYVSEYGTKRGRPHYHMLLFTDCEYLAKHANSVLRKTWQNGFIYVKPALDGARQYVAKYVSSGLRCSKNVSNPIVKIREKFSFSQKSKFFGFGFLEDQYQVFEEFIRPGTNRFVSRTESGFHAERLFNTFENYYFPNCYQFERVSSSILRKNLDRCNTADQLLIVSAIELSDFYATYLDYRPTGDKSFDAFQKRQYYISRRVQKLAMRFNISPPEYVYYILLFYIHKKENQLIDYLRNLEEFSKFNDYRLQYLQFSQFASRLNKHVTCSCNGEFDSILHFLDGKKIEDIPEVHDRLANLRANLQKSKKTRQTNDEIHNL